MAKTRVKKVVISGITSEQAEIAFSEFATADAKVQNIQSKMDMEITRIRDKYADILAEQQAIREKNFEIMQTFATEHREELFSKRKSYESAHGTFGFRTGTPKLKNVKGFTGICHQSSEGISSRLYPGERGTGKGSSSC